MTFWKVRVINASPRLFVIIALVTSPNHCHVRNRPRTQPVGMGDNKIGKELGMDSDEVLRLKQLTACKSCLPTVNFPAPGRLITTAGAGVLLLPATSIPSWQTETNQFMWEGIGAKHRQRNPATPCSRVSHWQNSTSSIVDRRCNPPAKSMYLRTVKSPADFI